MLIDEVRKRTAEKVEWHKRHDKLDLEYNAEIQKIVAKIKNDSDYGITKHVFSTKNIEQADKIIKYFTAEGFSTIFCSGELFSSNVCVIISWETK